MTAGTAWTNRSHHTVDSHHPLVDATYLALLAFVSWRWHQKTHQEVYR